MTWEAWLSLSLTIVMVIAMVRSLAAPDMVLLGGVAVLTATGILSPEEAFSGFANIGMLTVAVMFVISSGVQHTGGLDALTARLLGRPRSLAVAQLRMMLPVSALSAFLNNTPVVAMMIPVITDWSRRVQISPGRLFIPLSYASIIGGSCTLIGTATNLVLVGLAQDYDHSITFGMFEVGYLGLPVALVTILYTLLASRLLLPDRGDGRGDLFEQAREYSVAMRMEEGSPLVGNTIEGAGLRHLPGLFLIEIERADGQVRPAPGPNVKLHGGDRLVFAGVLDSVVDLQKIRGLVADEAADTSSLSRGPNRRLVEAVVAPQSRLLHQTVRDCRFRTHYGAAIIAVQRQGQRIRSKVGDIVLEPGDTLLLNAHPGFAATYKNDPTFALVSEVENSEGRRYERSLLAVALLIAMVVVGAMGWLPLITAALVAACIMVLTRCITTDQARRALDLRVLLTIAAAFAVGHALTKTGAAAELAQVVLNLAAPFGDFGLLTAVYTTTALLSAVITNTAAATLMFPITVAATEASGMDLKPFVYCLMLAASACFSTPIGYQTNLMVYGPGRYRFSDFTRFGLPLQLLAGLTTVTLAKWLWL